MNIAWYTRDGDLDFFALISKEFSKIESKVNSFYVCHTNAEEIKLQSGYSVNPWNLGAYLEKKEKHNINWHSQLELLQKKYNKIPLKRLVWGEIFELNISEEKLIFLLVNHFNFWEKFLTENKIDLILTEGPGILSTCVLWVICDKLNVQFLEYTPVGLPGRKNFRTSWEDGIHNFESLLKDKVVNKNTENYYLAKEYFYKMSEKPERPKYVGIELSTGKNIKEGSSYWKFPGFPSFKKIINYLINYKSKKNLNNYYLSSEKKKRYFTWLNTTIRLQQIRFSNIFEKTENLTDENFFLFPLHILNEWCDYTWMGLKYANITEVINNCAACLPLNTKLYVKEHPALFPGKPIRLYRAIKSIRNVRLISPYEDTFKLIGKSKGIITLGGTTGWEAYILGKPVILLADSWYRFLEGIFRVYTDFELAKILQNTIEINLPDQESKVQVISKLYAISFEASHYPQSEMNSRSNIKKSAKALKYFLKINYENINT